MAVSIGTISTKMTMLKSRQLNTKCMVKLFDKKYIITLNSSYIISNNLQLSWSTLTG